MLLRETRTNFLSLHRQKAKTNNAECQVEFSFRILTNKRLYSYIKRPAAAEQIHWKLPHASVWVGRRNTTKRYKQTSRVGIFTGASGARQRRSSETGTRMRRRLPGQL